MKQGAEHFLTKPVELSALLTVLERSITNQRNRQRQAANDSARLRFKIDPFLGESAAIRQLADRAAKVAASDRPVLILGETGSGKGVLARWLHDHGPRGEQAFVSLNCASLSPALLESEIFGHEKGSFTSATANKPGLLEVADRGTLFLDEIGDMELSIQAKLLKVLEEKCFRRIGEVRDRHVDVRLVAASHQPLGTMIRDKRFREDLYFRISTLPIEVPALRQRREDLPVLVERFLASLGQELGRHGLAASAAALEVLTRYPWPGNIRELRNVLERTVLLSEAQVIEPADLHFDGLPGADGADGSPVSLTLLEMEKRHIVRILAESGGSIPRAAETLDVPRSSLYQKIKKYGIKVPRVAG
jgi:DNA-binding NtrC family response regulator